MSIPTHVVGVLMCTVMLLGLGVPLLYAWLASFPLWLALVYVSRT